MATIALVAVGAKIAGGFAAGTAAAAAANVAIGAAVGGFVGGIIDNFFLFPAIFGSPSNDSFSAGQRLSELPLQSGVEGSAIKKCYGPEIRVPGNVIWMSDLIEEVTTETQEAGGKGGGSATATRVTYSYYVHVALLICEGEIDGVVKSWADGKYFQFQENDTLVRTGDQMYIRFLGDKNAFQIINEDPAGSGGDFNDFSTAFDFTMSGWSNAGNNGTFRFHNKADDYPTAGQAWMAGRPKTGIVAEGTPGVPLPGGDVTISQTLEGFSRVDDLRLYTGTTTQSKDSLLEAELGSANTPAYRGIAYTVLERLALKDYGNRLPNFTFLVRANTSPYTLATCISDILENCGVDSSLYDVTGISSSKTLRGFAVEGPQPVLAQLEPLLLAYDIGVQELNGKLVFYDRGDEEVIQIQESELAVVAMGEPRSPKIRLSEGPTTDLPSRLSVTYIDNTNDYQTAAASERITTATHINDATLDLPVVLSPGEAKAFVKRRIWSAWVERRNARIVLPPNYVDIAEGDIVRAPVNGENYDIRIGELNRGANFLHEIRGMVQQHRDYDYIEEGDDGNALPEGVYQPPSLEMVIVNCKPLSADQVSEYGQYWGTCAAAFDAPFLGAELYRAPASGGDFSALDSAPTEAQIVEALTELGDIGTTSIIDDVNTVDVRVLHGTLSSVTEAQLLEGQNRIYLGSEVIGFQTVASIGTNQYRLSKLLRGLLGTEAETGNHASGEFGLVLSGGGIVFSSDDISAIGLTRAYKPVAVGDSVTAVDEVTLELGKSTLEPYAPVHIEGEWDGSDYAVSWVRRDRLPFRLLTETPPPLSEASESYELELWDSTNSSVAQTYTGLSSPTKTIPAADLTGAGYSGTPGAETIYIRVYQISQIVGRGQAGIAELDG